MDKDKIDLKLTEDETVLILIKHLKSKGWDIDSYCLGQQRGYDIVASKYEQKLFVEVKGAKGNDNSPTKKRKYFDSALVASFSHSLTAFLSVLLLNFIMFV